MNGKTRWFAKRASCEHRAVLVSRFPFCLRLPTGLRVLVSRARTRARLYQDKHTPNCHPLKMEAVLSGNQSFFSVISWRQDLQIARP